MKPIVQYQIEVAICMAAFTLFYLLLWRKETNFQFKRYLLLAIPLFSIIIPMINLNIDLKPEQESATIQYITYLPNQLELVYTPIIAKTETLSGWEIAFWILSFGAMIMCIRLLISYLRIMQIYHKSTLSPSGKFRVVDDQIHAFSFFNMVIINKYQANSEDKEYILAHEHAHKKQGHSWDILYLELIKMLHWFNPIIWLLSRESKKNLEYMADQAVTYKTDNPQHYQYAIVQHASQGGYQLLKTQFSKTNLKNRIIMMNQPNNHKITSWKLITVLPLLAILLMSFSLDVENLDIKKKISEALPSFNSSVQYNDLIYEGSEVRPLPDGKQMKFFYEELYNRVENETGKRKNEIEGNVIAHFIVMKDGSLKDIRLIQGINTQIDDAIIQFIKEGPIWTPGLEVGEPVNVRMVLPINFAQKNISNPSTRIVSGKLVNEQNFAAIIGAKVEVKDSDIKTFTDEIGMFQISIEPQHTELLISSTEFETKAIPLHPSQGFINYMIRTDNHAKPIIKQDSITEVFTIVEDQPEPVGGDWTAYYESINKSIQYPQEAREKGIEGKVFVQFIVRKNGSLSDVMVVKGISTECDKEAVRVIKEGPDWIAGKQRGQKVNVRMILPVTFIADNKIMGTVMSEDRKPIAGANVVIKGTTTGTVTDTQGNFLLQVDEDHREIVISSLGYISQIKSIVPGTSYSVEMKFDPDNPPSPKMVGVIEPASGLQIRANGKDILDTEEKPLYILNGKEISSEDFSKIDPQTIASIQVLKDKYTTTFGEKGKNGVIIVKLKDHQTDLNNSDETLSLPNLTDVEITGYDNSDEIKISARGEFSIDTENPPLYIIEGVEMENFDSNTLNPDSVYSIQVIKDENAMEQYGEKGKNGVILIHTKSKVALDQLPEYEKGMDDFYKSIQKKIKYPLEARKANIQGKALVSFTITKDGEMTNIKAEKAEYALLKEIVVVGNSDTTEAKQNEDLTPLEEEVISIIRQLDKFKPGIKDGQPVDVRMTLPVIFKLAK